MLVRAFGGPEELEYTNVADPEPGPGQVLIEVAMAGVNFADIMARRGKYHAGGTPPFVPGLDVAGRVAALGPGVEGLRVGQRVAAFPETGSYAQLTVARREFVFPVPDAVDDETAAAFPVVACTAYALLSSVARLRAGEVVLVHAAAGGVGTTAVQLARLLGASRVIGTVGSDEKAELVHALGADAVVNYRSADYADRLRSAVGERGVDVILNSVAGEVLERDLEVLAPFGRLVVFGQASGSPGRVLSTQLHATSRAVLGYSLGTARRLRPASVRPLAEAVLRLLATGQLRIVVGRRFRLEEAAEAHRWVESRRSTGKVLLVVGG
ncbi:MAG: zinc-binding dehydrogenase [Clostridia bacterium]|nr:zinc-binding dehydrogenase [Clostridia bacterium]